MFNLMTFSDLLKRDQNIVESRLDQFGAIGILELFDRMLKLMNDLISEVEAYGKPDLSRKPTDSSRNVDNDRLRLHMLGVVLGQFMFAFSHVCRAQPSEAYGHMRRAIEAGESHTRLSQNLISAKYMLVAMRKRFGVGSNGTGYCQRMIP